MNVTREDLPGRQVALTIELEADVVSKALDRAYRQMVNQVNIPGFRPGRAPRHIVENYVGKEMLTERAVKNILPQTVQDAIAEQKIEAMDVGDVEIVSMDPLQVRVVVVQPPTVELGDYSSIKVEKEKSEITQEKVDEVLTELRRESAPWNELAEPRPIQEGDMVYLDLEGFTTEGALEEAARENFPTLVGVVHGGVPVSVNKALAGMSVGEEKDIADTLPDDYPNEALRGHDISYHVTVHSIKSQELPELNDEYAKTLQYDSVDDLRQAVDTNLKNRAEETASSNQFNEIISKLVEGSTIEVPQVMVNEELDGMVKSLETRLKEQRLSLRQYFTYNGLTEQQYREANQGRAMQRVIQTLAIQEFARREGISVDEPEIDQEIQQIISQFEGDEKVAAESVFSKHEARHDLEDRIFQRKVTERLVGIAEGTIEAAPYTPDTPEAEDEAATQEASSEGTSANTEEEKSKEEQPEDAGAGGKAVPEESAVSDTFDTENAGGAAELLNSDDAIRSPYETGEAEGGGTPADAPRLEGSPDPAK
ncbi:MAG: trigger factor [Chloroflexota bacterium]|nr:trigger factor [Chloroflexota bacterium]